jgi:glycosyltransferase involved in cell wall biosynthesis
MYNNKNNNIKKILYIHHGKGLGGAPLSLLYLIQALDKNIYHPIVLFLYDSEIIDLYKKNKIETIGPLNVCDFSHTKIWWFRWYHFHLILKHSWHTLKTINTIAPYWLNKIKPDIIHLNTSSLMGWAHVAHKKKIPVVWHIREPLAQGYLGLRKKLITHWVQKYATAITPICHHDALPWINNPKTQVIYNTVNPEDFNFTLDPNSFLEKHKLLPNSPKILFLGGLSQEKGALNIVKIFSQVLETVPQAQLLIAGYFDEPTRSLLFKKISPYARYIKQVQQILNPIKQSVIPLGPISNVAQAMAASNVIVFPATVGHFARPIIEAGFMKKPVIASAIPPLDELVINKKTGYLIPPNDFFTWTNILCQLLTNQALCDQLGQDGYIFCSQNFNITQHIQKIHVTYHNILST